MTLAAAALTACDRPGTYFDGERVQRVQLHAEWEMELRDQDFRSNPNVRAWTLEDGERLDIIMWPDFMGIYAESAVVRCANMGGAELIWYPKTDQFVCENVDH